MPTVKVYLVPRLSRWKTGAHASHSHLQACACSRQELSFWGPIQRVIVIVGWRRDQDNVLFTTGRMLRIGDALQVYQADSARSEVCLVHCSQAITFSTAEGCYKSLEIRWKYNVKLVKGLMISSYIKPSYQRASGFERLFLGQPVRFVAEELPALK